MIRRPPRSTRTDTLFPYTTLFRSQDRATAALVGNADAVFALGDLQYESGNLSDYLAGYDRSWGRFAKITFPAPGRSEEHTSELQSLMRISYAVFCLKKKKTPP